MAFHPTSTTSATTRLDDPDDLLLSYLNVDCLDTSNTPSIIAENINSDNNATQSPSSISSLEESFSPINSTYPSSWSSLPFLLNVNALATACIGSSSDLVTGISPCSISRINSPFSSTDMTSFFSTGGANAIVSHLSDTVDYQHTLDTSVTKSSSVSPTISTVSSVSSVPSSSSSVSSSSSSSDVEMPKRKRERKKQQNGSSKTGNAGLNSAYQQQSSMIHNCKPILPAQCAGTTNIQNQQRYNSNKQHWQSSNLVPIKPEPMDYSNSPVLACLDGNSNSSTPNINMTETNQQQQKYNGMDKKQKSANNNESSLKINTNPVDAHSKRQERLIKNRAAALLSRKRKREHLLALEHERQWLVKDNGLLKSKTAALETKIQQLEKENEDQKQQMLLLQRQHISFGDEDHPNSTFATMDPLSKVTNVLLILILSFALLTIPVTSNRSLIEETEVFNSNTSSKNDPKSMYHTLVSLPHQKQHFTRMDVTSDDSPADDPVHRQSSSGQQEEHHGKKRKRSAS